jgi:diacylglycerol kinase
MSHGRIERRTRVTSLRIVRSFAFAIAGAAYLFRTQRNARIHLLIGAVACGAGAWLHISRAEWAVVIFTIALVIILEGINTAIEAVVDLASPQFHPLAKVAKDVGAGMVLIAAIASVIVGLLIFGPPLWAKLAAP